MEKYILKRIEAMQAELEQIKQIISREVEAKPPKKTKLEGLWAGVEITDEELEEAKIGVFSDAEG